MAVSKVPNHQWISHKPCHYTTNSCTTYYHSHQNTVATNMGLESVRKVLKHRFTHRHTKHTHRHSLQKHTYTHTYTHQWWCWKNRRERCVKKMYISQQPASLGYHSNTERDLNTNERSQLLKFPVCISNTGCPYLPHELAQIWTKLYFAMSFQKLCHTDYVESDLHHWTISGWKTTVQNVKDEMLLLALHSIFLFDILYIYERLFK